MIKIKLKITQQQVLLKCTPEPAVGSQHNTNEEKYTDLQKQTWQSLISAYTLFRNFKGCLFGMPESAHEIIIRQSPKTCEAY